MFLQIPFRALTISSLTALALSACVTQQSPAPVIAGNGDGFDVSSSSTIKTPVVESTGVDVSSNPYGATPYTPTSVNDTVQNTVANVQSAATTTVNQVSNQVAKKVGTYVGNYSPVDVNAPTHTVEAGDTVYNIAKRYGISQESLRAWNNISLDNTISKGQVLHVKSPGSVSTPTASNNTIQGSTTQSSITNEVGNLVLLGNASTPVNKLSARTIDGITWQAPVQGGTVIQGYGNGNHGVDIRGNRGQSVYAVADGIVVYSRQDGSKLRGYGNMIIIQHEKKYLTAYGNNDRLLVQEGHTVQRGQQIATMGDSDSNTGVRLHFEMRKEGKPFNPINFVSFE